VLLLELTLLTELVDMLEELLLKELDRELLVDPD